VTDALKDIHREAIIDPAVRFDTRSSVAGNISGTKASSGIAATRRDPPTCWRVRGAHDRHLRTMKFLVVGDITWRSNPGRK